MLVTTLAVVASTTCAIAGLPDIGRHLLATQAELQWIVDISAVSMSALLLPAGAIADRYGRRRVLIIGMVLLCASLTWSGVAGSPEELIIARMFTGIGAALALPGTLATLTTVFPGEERARVVAMWAAAMMIGGTLGLVCAGGFVAIAWWGSFFVAIAVIVAGALVVIVLTVPETRAPEDSNLDPVGALLSLVAIGALVFAVIEAPVRGIGDPLVVGAFVTGSVTLVGFGLWELHTPRPMLDPRLFTSRAFAGGSTYIFALYVACGGWYFLSFQYCAYVLGYSPLLASLALIPSAFGAVPGTQLGAALMPRYGWRTVVTASVLITVASMLVMAHAGADREMWPLLAFGFWLFGLGLGLGQQPATLGIVDGLPPEKQGIASAVNDTARELGVAVGIAVMGAIFNAAYRSSIDDSLVRLGDHVTGIVRDSPPAGIALAGRGGPAGGLIHDAVVTGTVAGWQAAFAAGATILLLAAAYIYKRAPRAASAASATAARPPSAPPARS